MNTKKITSLLLCAVCLMTSVVLIASNNSTEVYASSVAQDKAKIAQLEKQLEKEQNKAKNIQNDIAKARQDTQSQVSLKQALDDDIENTAGQISTSKKIVAEFDVSIQMKELEITLKEKEYDESYSNFLSFIRYTYENKDTGLLDILLGSKSLTDFLQRMDYMEHILKYNEKVMLNLEQQKKDLEVKKAGLIDDKKDKETIQASLEAQERELSVKRDEANKVIASLKANTNQYIASYEDSLKSMNAVQDEIKKAIQEMQAKQNASVFVGGTFQWPLDSTYVSSFFGNRRNPITGKTEFHTGIDIAKTYAGAPIYAANSGRVMIAEVKGTYGKCVVIDHGGGMTTLYAHCSSLSVSAGQSVNKGDVIAAVGSTGFSTGNHLHFEISKNGSRIDPMSYFKKK